jgi:hypothetical protein
VAQLLIVRLRKELVLFFTSPCCVAVFSKAKKSLASLRSRMADQWGAYLEEYLTNPTETPDKVGACVAAMLIGADGAAYAAAPTAGDAGWGLIYADPHEEDILQDDGETYKKMTVDENKAIIAAFEKKRAPPEGLWIAGKKFKFIGCAEDEADDQKFTVLKMKLEKKNCIAVKTGSQYIVALADEEANAKGTQGNLNALCVAFASWMVSEGY